MKKRLFHNKITALTLARRIIQLLAFVLFPGLFISVFSAMKSIYAALIGGTFSAATLAGPLVLVIATLFVTAIMGRFFCGFLCAFGSMGDLFWYLGTKLKLPRPKIGAHLDRMLKNLKYILLVLIVALVWTLGAALLDGTANPWTVFGMLSKPSGWTSLAVVFSTGALLLLLIAVGSLFIERMFCRYLCPLGAVFAIVSKFRLFRIRKPRRVCGSCRACTKRCPMGIALYRTDVVKSAECIDCMNCVEICPKDNVKMNPKPAIAAAVAVVSLSGMYYAGNAASAASAEQQTIAAAASLDAALSETDTSGPFIDGTYTGTASGYRGETSVEVTVENGYITGISIVSTGDDAEFFNQAKTGVIPAIISAQSVSVDTVTGATFSSRGIIDAVSDALSGAAKTDASVTTITNDESAATPTPALTPTPSPEPTATPDLSSVETGTLSLADGTYTGTGTGFRGETEVTVTVENGTITSIVIDSYQDDAQYFSRAKSTILSEVLDQQSVDVDTVSGATYSSNGILEAIADALSQDYEATTPSSGGGHNQNHGGH